MSENKRKIIVVNPIEPPIDIQEQVYQLTKTHRERRRVKTSIWESTTKSLSGD